MCPSPRFHSLDEWLDWQEQLHPSGIELGLDRIGRVAKQLDCSAPAKRIISVAGTNGKGSSVALLEAILLAAGYRVACYTSPHLFRYNERIRIQGEPVSDNRLCEAFDRVDRARGDQTLTYFEFGTLAALDLMSRERLDIAVLEVGLGGRLDAVNIVDADVSLVTAVGLDHIEWLGDDREAIGVEKAGIFRAGRPAVCSDPNPPRSVRREADRIGADWRAPGEGFRTQAGSSGWDWWGRRQQHAGLPLPGLPGAHQLHNAAGVLAVLEALEPDLPVPTDAIQAGLRGLQLPGRVQRLAGTVEQVLDVSHNAEAATALADTLEDLPVAGDTYAVLGMMQDKDAESFVRALERLVSGWYPVGLAVERASSSGRLAQLIEQVCGTGRVVACDSVAVALERIRTRVKPGDRVLVCGSFYTVAEWASLKPVFG